MEAIDALKEWSLSGPVRPIDGGLINRTFQVGEPAQAVLQWLNPIFAPEVTKPVARGAPWQRTVTSDASAWTASALPSPRHGSR